MFTSTVWNLIFFSCFISGVYTAKCKEEGLERKGGMIIINGGGGEGGGGKEFEGGV